MISTSRGFGYMLGANTPSSTSYVYENDVLIGTFAETCIDAGGIYELENLSGTSYSGGSPSSGGDVTIEDIDNEADRKDGGEYETSRERIDLFTNQGVASSSPVSRP